MSVGNSVENSTSVRESLRAFRLRAAQLLAAGAFLWLITGAIIGLVVLLWLDTIVALSAPVRWFTTRPLPVLAAAGCIAWVAWKLWGTAEVWLARRIDQKGKTGGQILAGLQLETEEVKPGTELSKNLAQIAVQRTQQLLKTIAPSSVFEWKQLKRVAIYLAVSAAAVVAVALIAPGVASHQLNRFLYPTSDIPPFTGVVIDLEVEKEQLLYGQDTLVNAVVSTGRIASDARMTLVVETKDGSESVLPMLAQDQQQWQAILTGVRESVTVFARSGRSMSTRKQIEVIMTPQILPPQIKLTPPEYTRAAAYEGSIPEDGIVGLEGSQLEIAVPSNRPLRSARLMFLFDDETQQQITFDSRLDSDDQTLVRGSFELEKPGEFELSVVDVEGIESQESVRGRITISQDRRPTVRILTPREQSLATPDISLPVEVLAEDDYGITSLTLYRSLNGSPPLPISGAPEDLARVQQRWSLPLPKYRLQPGDEIQLFARTEDNDPAGPKGAESPVTTVKIISVQEFQEMMLQRKGAQALEAKYQQARREFEKVASALKDVQEAQAELEKNPESAEAKKNLAEKMAAAEQAAKEASKALEKLGEQAMPIDIDQQLAKKLSEMAKQAQEMAKQLNKMQAGQKSEGQPSQQPPLTDEQKEQIQQMLEQAQQKQKDLNEQAIEPMKNMQKMMPLIVAEQRFVQIARQQRDLSNRLNALKMGDDSEKTQRRVAELEAEQEQLRQSLGQLLDDIGREANNLGDEPDLQKLKTTALEFANDVRDSQAIPEMAAAQESMLIAEYQDAQGQAEHAAEILESFLSKCEGMGKGACKNCQKGFNPGGGQLGNSIQQMMAMMGMKPSSSMSPGGKPGMGMGWGAGGGMAQRFPGKQNMGLYGSIPMPQSSPRSGRGGDSTLGASTGQAPLPGEGGQASPEVAPEHASTGQGINLVPAQYRARVADYYRILNESLGELPEN
ncbi:MAG: hypothetical protein AAF394_00715 [Planctomycetota bacterium]